MNPSFSDSQIVQVDQLILHHYASSPFSEKVRAILSFKDVPWTSVEIPDILPKPDVIALTGAYRKTPILQIGAHIYCDSALIAEVLERLAPTPAIFPPESAGTARFLAQWADSTLFWTAAAYVFQPEGAAALMATKTPEERKAFAEDRAQFRGQTHRMRPADATAALLIYLRRFETMLIDERVWLLGFAASIADFSVYHCLWFIRRAASLGAIIDDFPHVVAWYERMRRLVQPPHADMTSESALRHAADEAPQEIEAEFYTDTHGIALGQQVVITPTDTGCDPVEGELVLAMRDELAVRRFDDRVGELIVHFPRLGFEMKKAAWTSGVAWTWKRFEALSGEEVYDMLALRSAVFVLEQGCPFLDPDGCDRSAWHLLGHGVDGDGRSTLVAYLRCLDPQVKYPEPSIGRVVTAPAMRGHGLGRVLMDEGIARTQHAWPGADVVINAQQRLEPFYRSLHFHTEGEPYVEDDIDHVQMRHVGVRTEH